MLGWLVVTASAHVSVVYYAGPEDDWCAVINATEGSDIIMLLPGTYTGPCDIHANLSDVAAEQTSVQSFDPNDPARFVGSDADYVLSAAGEQLVLFQLSFEGLPAHVDAVRINDIRSLWIRWSWFTDLPGTAVRTVGVPRELLVEDNELTDVGVVAVIGCPDGGCAAPAFQVEDNLVTRAGTAFDVAPGSSGTFVDNVMIDVDTAVRIGGAGAGGTVRLDRELYQGTGPLLDVLAGPAAAVSSILIADALAVRATGVEGVDLLGDTVIGPVELSGPGVRLVGSALDGPLPTGVDTTGSIGCGEQDGCFTDLAAWDLYPAPDSPLRQGGTPDPALISDWCGRARPNPPTVGALEVAGPESFGPLEAVFKDDFDCTLEGDTGGPGTDPGGPTTRPPEQDPEHGGACGCASGGTGLLPGALVLLAGALRSRTRR